jgi:hypothetical protein
VVFTAVAALALAAVPVDFIQVASAEGAGLILAARDAVALGR